MDLTQFKLGVDTWLGSLDIQEDVLKAAGVDFIIPRLNDCSGAVIREDGSFDKEWSESKAFARAAYYVVSPFYTLQDQLKFLDDNLPDDCQVVCPDLEIRGNYGTKILDVLAYLKDQGKTIVCYSGAWVEEFISLPTGYRWWWAAYPNLLYPANSLTLTWDTLKYYLGRLNWTPGVAPGPIDIWQCSGDMLVLPGCAGRAVDINIMPVEAYNRIFQPAPVVANKPTTEQRLDQLEAWAVTKGYIRPTA